MEVASMKIQTGSSHIIEVPPPDRGQAILSLQVDVYATQTAESPLGPLYRIFGRSIKPNMFVRLLLVGGAVIAMQQDKRVFGLGPDFDSLWKVWAGAKVPNIGKLPAFDETVW